MKQSLRWLAAVAADYLIIIIAVASAYHSAWLIVPAALVIGNRQHAIVNMGHYGAHGAMSPIGWLNDWTVNALCFWPFGLGLSGYRAFHFAHHRFLGTPQDPELFLKASVAPRYAVPASRKRILAGAAAALFGDAVRESAVNIWYIASRNSWRDVIAAVAVLTLAVIALWHWDAWLIAYLWLGSLATSFWAVFRLRVWVEHIGTAGTHRISATLFQRAVFLPHNIWCHWEHHKHPGMPWWQLPQVRDGDQSAPIVSVGRLLASYE